MIESIQSAPEIDNSCEDDEALRVADPAVLQLFEEGMRNIYRESTKFGYYPNRFLQMIEERGALETARHLLHSPHLSDGFITLWERNASTSLSKLSLAIPSGEACSQKKIWKRQ